MKITIKNPMIEKVKFLKAGTCFWMKRDRSLYTIIGQNCHTDRLMESEKKTFPDEERVVVFCQSLNLITTVPADRDVVVAADARVVASAEIKEVEPPNTSSRRRRTRHLSKLL